MEKRIIKKDALAGVFRKISEGMVVYAPVQDEDNVIFKVLKEGEEPLLEYANTKKKPG